MKHLNHGDTADTAKVKSDEPRRARRETNPQDRNLSLSFSVLSVVNAVALAFRRVRRAAVMNCFCSR
jgi:hypothetical protein